MSKTTKIRRQGGAAIMTIPQALLKMMETEIGGEMTLAVVDGGLIARPVRKTRKRYTLSELLEGSERMAELNAAVAGAMEGDPVGREIG